MFAVVGETIKSRASQFLGNVPKFVNCDVLISIDHTIVVLICVSPVEFEELHEFVRDMISLHLSTDAHSPFDKLVHRNGAIAIFISSLHQKRKRLLLTSIRVVVEFVAWLNRGCAGELLHDGFVVLKVDHSIAVHVISVSEEKLQFLPEKIAHGSWFGSCFSSRLGSCLGSWFLSSRPRNPRIAAVFVVAVADAVAVVVCLYFHNFFLWF